MAVVGWCMFNVMRASKDDEEEDRKVKSNLEASFSNDTLFKMDCLSADCHGDKCGMLTWLT